MIRYILLFVFFVNASIAIKPIGCGWRNGESARGFSATFWNYPINSKIGYDSDFPSEGFNRHGYMGYSKNIQDPFYMKGGPESGGRIGEIYRVKVPVTNYAVEIFGFFRPRISGSVEFSIAVDKLTFQFGASAEKCSLQALEDVISEISIDRRGDHKKSQIFEVERNMIYPFRILKFNDHGSTELLFQVQYLDSDEGFDYKDILQPEFHSSYFTSWTTTDEDGSKATKTGVVVTTTKANGSPTFTTVPLSQSSSTTSTTYTIGTTAEVMTTEVITTEVTTTEVTTTEVTTTEEITTEETTIEVTTTEVITTEITTTEVITTEITTSDVTTAEVTTTEVTTFDETTTEATTSKIAKPHETTTSTSEETTPDTTSSETNTGTITSDKTQSDAIKPDTTISNESSAGKTASFETLSSMTSDMTNDVASSDVSSSGVTFPSVTMESSESGLPTFTQTSSASQSGSEVSDISIVVTTTDSRSESITTTIPVTSESSGHDLTTWTTTNENGSMTIGTGVVVTTSDENGDPVTITLPATDISHSGVTTCTSTDDNGSVTTGTGVVITTSDGDGKLVTVTIPCNSIPDITVTWTTTYEDCIQCTNAGVVVTSTGVCTSTNELGEPSTFTDIVVSTEKGDSIETETRIADKPLINTATSLEGTGSRFARVQFNLILPALALLA